MSSVWIRLRQAFAGRHITHLVRLFSKLHPSPRLLWGLLGLVLLAFPSLYQRLLVPRPRSLTASEVISSPSSPVTPAADPTSAADPIRIDSRLINRSPISQVPSRIVVPHVSIDLPVVEAPVVNGAWKLSDTTASHGVGSALPGEDGNIVIFAHARPGLFLSLRDIKPSQTIYVLTADHWFVYQVTQTKEILPSQIEVIAPTSHETLTLYTCSGFLDSKRLVVTAAPITI